MEQNEKNFHPVHEIFDGFTNTLSGTPVSLLDPQPDMITIEDIACSLGKICRFNGQINQFYSVAQHSVIAAALVPKKLRKAALLHDASEAYLGDVISPLKAILNPAYKILEDRFMKVIGIKFGIDPTEFEQVKEVDKQLCEIEHKVFQKGNKGEWLSLCLGNELSTAVFGPAHAEHYFLSTYYQIFETENY